MLVEMIELLLVRALSLRAEGEDWALYPFVLVPRWSSFYDGPRSTMVLVPRWSSLYDGPRSTLAFMFWSNFSSVFAVTDANVIKLSDLKLDFLDTILDLGVYRAPPDGVSLPPKYRPPALVRKDIYWQGWKLVVLLAAAEPTVFGEQMLLFWKVILPDFNTVPMQK